MPLKNYALLKGRAVAVRQGSGQSPHYQIKIVDDLHEYRIAVNIQSGDGSEVEFLVRQNFDHPLTQSLATHKTGLTSLKSGPAGGGLDYIRGNLAQPWEFVPLPAKTPGPDNDLNEKIEAYAQRAMADESALVYAFGETWGPEEDKRDKYFGFLPGRGIHDIHMNQGNPAGRFAKDNGVWQDGGLVFEFPGQNQWVAVFLRFQTQSWHTDDTSGHAIAGDGGTSSEPQIIRPHRQPTFELPDGMIRIVGALVNDVHTPERETVTVLNTSDVDVDLTGWAVADSQKRRSPLSGTIARGTTRVFDVAKPAELTNKGGIITLLNDKGVKVHGVAYSREQARHPGWTLAFPN